MSERDATRLRDMLDAARTALDFASGRTRDDLDKDVMFAFALVRALEIVGEAANAVSESTRAAEPGIPWRNIIGMRHKIAHDYFAVDYGIVWDVVELDLPPLVTELERLLK